MQFKYDFQRYTYNDYKNWKEDWELIDGFPVQFLPSATAKHNRMQGSLFFQAKLSFNKSLEKCNCEIFTELDWKISTETVVRPDLMIVCGKSLTDYLEFPPVLIIEIISPLSVKNDRVIKFDLYSQSLKTHFLNFHICKDKSINRIVDKKVEPKNNLFFDLI